MKILVFEGRSEIIFGDPAQVEKLVDTWFNDTGRSLEEYETYTFDGAIGFSFSTEFAAGGTDYEHVEVRDMISASLRRELNSGGALDVEDELAAYSGGSV